MSTTVHTSERTTASYGGLRMTAEEFLRLPDDGYRYELIDGVVIVSPGPTAKHQAVVLEIARQLANHLAEHDVGVVLHDIDVHLGEGPTGGDLVYRPDVVFVRKEHLLQIQEKVSGAPDLVVEVISPASVRFDAETKKDDYENSGVREYWLIDPRAEAMTFYRLQEGRYVAVRPPEGTFASEAVPGFKLDLARIRRKFQPWRR